MNEHKGSSSANVVLAMTSSLAIAFSAWLYTERTRFSMIQSGDRAYRYDRITGEMWLVVEGKYGAVDGPVEFAD